MGGNLGVVGVPYVADDYGYVLIFDDPFGVDQKPSRIGIINFAEGLFYFFLSLLDFALLEEDKLPRVEFEGKGDPDPGRVEDGSVGAETKRIGGGNILGGFNRQEKSWLDLLWERTEDEHAQNNQL